VVQLLTGTPAEGLRSLSASSNDASAVGMIAQAVQAATQRVPIAPSVIR
jgi:hypothetical protein